MNTDTIAQFRARLSTRFGWRLDDDRGQLADVLASRLRPGQSAESYVAELPRAADEEIRALAESLTVSETYFFRNPEQFAALADIVLPDRIRAKPEGPIRILSAGSASGEEAYSIAMVAILLRERQVTPPVEIVGIDVSPRVVKRARTASYSRWALRGLPPALRERFFDAADGHFELRREVRSMVRFEERNLLQPGAFAIDGRWDVVFFRNTCMYFTSDAARTIMSGIADAMVPGGFLFLGHAENLRGLSDAFDLHHTHQTFYYVRTAPGRRGTTDVVAPSQELTKDVAAGADASASNDDWFQEIARATERVAALIDRRDPPVEPPDAPRANAGRRPLLAALSLLEQERYEDALAAVGAGNVTGADADRLLLRAVLLTHLGRIDEARAACQAVLAADSTEAGAHYVLALCEERAGNVERAVAADETAIYLDDTFAMPHLHLGLLARRGGDEPTATRHLRAAHALLLREDRARILLFGGGFGRQALLRFCDTQTITPVLHAR